MIKYDKFGYIIESTPDERLELHTTISRIHFKLKNESEHRALCNSKIRNFLTRDVNQITCNDCLKKTLIPWHKR